MHGEDSATLCDWCGQPTSVAMRDCVHCGRARARRPRRVGRAGGVDGTLYPIVQKPRRHHQAVLRDEREEESLENALRSAHETLAEFLERQ